MDRTAKALLAAIALGLWANAAAAWSQPLLAQGFNDVRIVTALLNMQTTLYGIESNISGISASALLIESDVNVIDRGTCSNGKLC